MIDTAIEIGKKLAEQHLIDGSSGNLSFRKGIKMIITRTGAMLDMLTPEDFIEVDLGKSDSRASSDLKVHQRIYDETDYSAVIHCHGTYNVALSFIEGEIIPIDLEGTMFLKKIAFVDGRFGSDELAEKIAREIRENGFAVVKGHGIYTAGKDFRDAYRMASFVEHSCRVYYLTKLFSLLGRH